MRTYRAGGPSAIKDLMLRWEYAYCISNSEDTTVDLKWQIKGAIINVAPFDSDKRLVIKVWDKRGRDELLKRLKLSPARP
jgi:hypothetical protein